MGKWNDAINRMNQSHSARSTRPSRSPYPPLDLQTLDILRDELYKALQTRKRQASDVTTASTFKEAIHLPLMRQQEPGGRGPSKLMGASFEILRAFVRQNPWVGAAVSIRQREVASSKWRIVPDLESHKNELDLLRQVVMGARQFPDVESMARGFRSDFLPRKMIAQLLDTTMSTDISPSDVRYRFRLAYLELLLEANRHIGKPRKLLERPNSTGDVDSWAEMLKGIVPDILILDSGCCELRRSDSPLDDYGHPLPTNPILELHWVDGATIRPCLDDYGALCRPSKEDPQASGYEQWIDNQRVGSFQRHNLIRFIENPQTDILFRGYGYARVEYLLMTLILESHGDKAKLEELKRQFYGGFLNVKSKSWVQEDIDAFRGYIEEQLEGNRRLPILAFPDGAEWISTAMKEASSNNSVEQRRMHIERVCAIFEMPPVKLGITNTSNYSTSEVSQDAGDEGERHLLDVVDKGVTQWIVRDPGFGTYPYLKYESRPAHEREDDTELDRLQKELNMGVATPNEIRMERGDGPVEKGDQPFAYFDSYHKSKGQTDGQGGQGMGMNGEGGEGGEMEEGDENADGTNALQGDRIEGEEGESQGENGMEAGGPPDRFGDPKANPGQSRAGQNPLEEPTDEIEKALSPLRSALHQHRQNTGTLPHVEVEILP